MSALVMGRGARWRELPRGHAALGRRGQAVAAGGPPPAAQVPAHRGTGDTIYIQVTCFFLSDGFIFL